MLPHSGHPAQLLLRGVQHPGQRAEPLHQLVGQPVHIPRGWRSTAAVPGPGGPASPPVPGRRIHLSPAAGALYGWICASPPSLLPLFLCPLLPCSGPGPVLLQIGLHSKRGRSLRGPLCAFARRVFRGAPVPPGGPPPLSEGTGNFLAQPLAPYSSR